jgi:hypothetical protein
MSNIQPVYPSGLFQWVDRIDNADTDFANDINSVASDLISVEGTLGTTPQIEKTPPNNSSSIVYPSVDARLSDAMGGVQLPVGIFRAGPFPVNNVNSGEVVHFNADYDPYGLFNGTDVTINVSGWFYITVHVNWSWWNNGFVHTFLAINGASNSVDQEIIDWQFSGNTGGGNIPNIPRWQQFGKRPRIVHLPWQGHVTAGNRISVYNENGTSNSSLSVLYAVMKVSMLKTIPSTAAEV